MNDEPLLSLLEIARRFGFPCDTPRERRASREKVKRIVVREFETYIKLPHVRDGIKAPESAVEAFLRSRCRVGLKHCDVGGWVGAAMKRGESA